MTVAKMTARAEILMASYREMTGSDPDDQLSDLLADLMHWAEAQEAEKHGTEPSEPQRSFDAELARARYPYEAEREEGE
jgi:hypothetical protein